MESIEEQVPTSLFR